MGIRDADDVDDSDVGRLQDWARRGNDRVMRAGKAKNAVITAGMIGCLGRRGWRAVRVMMAKFESRRGRIGWDSLRKSAERDQKTLHGDGIGNHNRDQRSPKPARCSGKLQHATPRETPAIMRKPPAGVNARNSASLREI